MKDLSFNTGMIELAIQGDKSRVLRFNPSNGNVVKGFMQFVKSADAEQKKLTKETKKIKEANLTDMEKIEQKLELDAKLDTFVRTELDKIFGVGTAKMVFEDLCITALTESGEPVFAEFIYALMPHFKEATERGEKVHKIIEESRP